MPAQFVEISTEADLDQVLDRSYEEPIILYLHDPYCGLSEMAHAELSQLEQRLDVIDVHAHHDLSTLVEQRTGVRHESPQVLLLHDGEAHWSASHRKVKAGAVIAALGAENGSTVDGSQSARRDSLVGSLASRISRWYRVRNEDASGE
jgi:bacillithiol system protein YtxJ